MANEEHLQVLRKGSAAWNRWREKHPDVTQPDLSGATFLWGKRGNPNLNGADLSCCNLEGLSAIRLHARGANLVSANLVAARLRSAELSNANLRGALLARSDLSGADLSDADLSHATLSGADLSKANLQGATLHRSFLNGTRLGMADLTDAKLVETELQKAQLTCARLVNTDLHRADLTGARLSQADLSRAILSDAILDGATLRKSNLTMASLVGTSLKRARISQSIVYGVSAWGVNLNGALQKELRVTGSREESVTVDDLEVAQFIYLMLHNEKIRNIIDTLTSKVVLILGRFSPDRKAILDAIRNELRRGEHDLVPVLFDFSIPADRNLTETVTLLARMARFIVADLTDPSSIPQELQAIVPHVHVPVVPLLHAASPREYAMFLDQLDFPWVLTVRRYGNVQNLLDSFADKVIIPAENNRRELEERRRRRRSGG